MREPLPIPTLAELCADPARGLDVPPREAEEMLLALAPVQRALELAAGKVVAPGRNGRGTEPGDRLLNAKQVGERLDLTVRQVYRRAGRWPFTVRLSEGTLRFSERGFEQFAAGKKAR